MLVVCYDHHNEHYTTSMSKTQGPVAVEPSNQLAPDYREGQFEALAAFANLSEDPKEWKKFRLMWPAFFPTADTGLKTPGFETLSEWFYSFAEEWASLDVPASCPIVPALLWYRNRLRAFWTRHDPYGYHLAVLLGFEQQADEIRKEHFKLDEGVAHPFVVPGQTLGQEVSRGLPPGRAVVNGKTGEISWKFGCEFQQAVYELIPSRWRARVCELCGRYYVAVKTAQRFCSAGCASEQKQKRDLDWWRREGSTNRDKRLKAQRRQKRK